VVNAPENFSLGILTAGKADTFYFIVFMSKNQEIASKVKYSSLVSAPTERNTVSIEAFNIEKNAKNKAYCFILSNGLFDRFAEFCKDYHSDDPHRDCLEYLLSKTV
jgi:hypothetical protein